MRKLCHVCALSITLLAANTTLGQQRFSELVGNVRAEPVKASSPLLVPYITWGGDVATFQANGGITTKRGSTYDKLGLKLKLTSGDDFIQQGRDEEHSFRFG